MSERFRRNGKKVDFGSHFFIVVSFGRNPILNDLAAFFCAIRQAYLSYKIEKSRLLQHLKHPF